MILHAYCLVAGVIAGLLWGILIADAKPEDPGGLWPYCSEQAVRDERTRCAVSCIHAKGDVAEFGASCANDGQARCVCGGPWRTP